MIKLLYFMSSLFLFWSNALSQDPCTTPSGQKSNCIPITDCPQLNAPFVENTMSLSNKPLVSFLRQSHCGFARRVPKVCCGPLTFQNNNNIRTTPAPIRNRPLQYNLDPSQVDAVNQIDSSLAPSDSCGQDTSGSRIMGGNVTQMGEHPWLGLMGYRNSTGHMNYRCGSALLNQRYLLTAAHCIIGEIRTKVGELTSVRLGEYDIRTEKDCVNIPPRSLCADPVQEIAVQTAFPHPRYSDYIRKGYNDIGIVRLAKRATYNSYVQPICLVSSNERLAVGSFAYVAGWGMTSWEGEHSPVKLKVMLPIFDQKQCRIKYEGDSATWTQLCAGGEAGRDSCKGDSGGPLMRLRRNNIWEAVGVVSTGHNCGEDGWPGIYTSVASYRDWIEDTIRSTNVE